MAIPAITVRLRLRHTLRHAIIKSFSIIHLHAIDANFFFGLDLGKGNHRQVKSQILDRMPGSLVWSARSPASVVIE
jgi:hypothetical protein